jgi:hypothetical protein
MQGMELGFRMTMGSAKAAGQEMAFLRDLAEQVPFPVENLVQADLAMRVFAKEAKFSGVNMHELIKATSDFASIWAIAGKPEAFEKIQGLLGRIMVGLKSPLIYGPRGFGGLGLTVDILKQYGIEFDKNNKVTSDAATQLRGIQAAMLGAFGGMAQEAMGTYTGRMMKFKNLLHEVYESVGKALLPTLSLFARAASTLAKAFGEVDKATHGALGYLTAFGGVALVAAAGVKVLTTAMATFAAVQAALGMKAGAGMFAGGLGLGGAGAGMMGRGLVGAGGMALTFAGIERARSAQSPMGVLQGVAMGAAGGALTGTAIMPGWGTLIGGVIGAVSTAVASRYPTEEKKDSVQSQIEENTRATADALKAISGVMLAEAGVRSSLFPGDLATVLRNAIETVGPVPVT